MGTRTIELCSENTGYTCILFYGAGNIEKSFRRHFPLTVLES